MPRKQISKKNNKNRKLKKKNKHSKKKTKTKKKVINRKIKTRKNKKKYLDRNKQVGGADFYYSHDKKETLITKHIQGFETVFADQKDLKDDIKFNLCYLKKKNSVDFDILIEQLRYGGPFYDKLITDNQVERKVILREFFSLFLEKLETEIGLLQNIESGGYRLKGTEHQFIEIDNLVDLTFKINFYKRTPKQRERSVESTYNNSLEIIIKPDVPNQDLLEELCAILLGNTVFWYAIKDNFDIEDINFNCNRILEKILEDSQSQSQRNYSGALQESQSSQGSIEIVFGDSQDSQATQQPSQGSQTSLVFDLESSQQYKLHPKKLKEEKDRIDVKLEGGSQTLTYPFLEKKYDQTEEELTQILSDAELLYNEEEATPPPD